MKSITKIASVLATVCLTLTACDTSDIEGRIGSLEDRVQDLEQVVQQTNDNAIALHKLLDESNVIVGYSALEHGYLLELSDGSKVNITYGTEAPVTLPTIGIDADGCWIMSYDGVQWTKIQGCPNAYQSGPTPLIRTDQDGWWEMSLDGGQTYTQILSNGQSVNALNGGKGPTPPAFFESVEINGDKFIFHLVDGRSISVAYDDGFGIVIKQYSAGQKVMYLSDEAVFEVELRDVAKATIKVPQGWNAELTDSKLTIWSPASGTAGAFSTTLMLVSSKGYLKSVEVTVTLNPITVDEATCTEWREFDSGATTNVLLDYSYAGYDHGESAPADVYTLGYKVYNVCDYGAVPNDGLSDREAFIRCLEAAVGTVDRTKTDNLPTAPKPKANAIVYFPEGEFILHEAADNVGGKSLPIVVRAGNFVLKGAGRDLTRIVMKDPMLPTNPNQMYSSPDMIQFKHFSTYSDLTTITADSAKGSYAVTVASTTGIKVGDWVCLHVANNDADYIAEELSPYSASSSWEINSTGVSVIDHHQVKSIEGNIVTFYEPIMHAVDASRGWTLKGYPHYEEVGVEDLTFVGQAKADFVHHGSWMDDGAYKPITLMRLTNSWMRRVGFESVSEACSIIAASNVSAYDITFTGHRGHAAIRSQQSSRVFIGATFDHASGPVAKDNEHYAQGTMLSDAGQYHAVGVSKQSMGAVLWRNTWGYDSCFESHATQPRATLIDCCQGGFMALRQGGDDTQMPNHLADLTLWNFESTTSVGGPFIWWDARSLWWKFLPPTIVGFHGQSVTFDQSQVTRDSSHGTPVYPESLYEAQLKRRLGYVPAWLNELKSLQQ